MNIRIGSKILKEINAIVTENPNAKAVLDCCQQVENCVLGLLREAYPGENVMNLINAYRKESNQG